MRSIIQSTAENAMALVEGGLAATQSSHNGYIIKVSNVKRLVTCFRVTTTTLVTSLIFSS